MWPDLPFWCHQSRLSANSPVVWDARADGEPIGQDHGIPVRGNFLEGLSVLEYFLSSHGARKGFMDRSLNTAESGYLFLRLINAAQSVIVTQEDCGTHEYLLITEAESQAEGLPDYRSCLIGRVLAKAIPGVDFLAEGSELDEDRVDRLLSAGVQEVPCAVCWAVRPDEVFAEPAMGTISRHARWCAWEWLSALSQLNPSESRVPS